MNAQDIDRAVRRLGRDIAERAKASGAARDLAIVGIRRGGVHLAVRLRKELTAALDHRPTALAVKAERALLGTLEGGCQVPIAAHAEWKMGGERGAGMLRLEAFVGSLDGTRTVRGERLTHADDPEGLGIFLAAELLERGAGDILGEIRDL